MFQLIAPSHPRTGFLRPGYCSIFFVSLGDWLKFFSGEIDEGWKTSVCFRHGGERCLKMKFCLSIALQVPSRRTLCDSPSDSPRMSRRRLRSWRRVLSFPMGETTLMIWDLGQGWSWTGASWTSWMSSLAGNWHLGWIEGSKFGLLWVGFGPDLEWIIWHGLQSNLLGTAAFRYLLVYYLLVSNWSWAYLKLWKRTIADSLLFTYTKIKWRTTTIATTYYYSCYCCYCYYYSFYFYFFYYYCFQLVTYNF